MTTKRPVRIAAAAISVGLVLAACGGDDDDDAGTSAEDTAEDTAADTPTEDSSDMSEESGDMSEESGDTSEGSGDAAAMSLADICPSPLVFQTDWFPEAEHGAL